MKNNRQSLPAERNYALRRVIYDAMVAAKAVEVMDSARGDSLAKETAKIAGLMMVRNLDDFFPKSARKHKYPDDIFVGDFSPTWTPSWKDRPTDVQRERINKLVGHIVAWPPTVVRDREARKLIIGGVDTAVQFVNHCREQNLAKYTGNAGKYWEQLNRICARLGIGVMQTQ